MSEQADPTESDEERGTPEQPAVSPACAALRRRYLREGGAGSPLARPLVFPVLAGATGAAVAPILEARKQAPSALPPTSSCTVRRVDAVEPARFLAPRHWIERVRCWREIRRERKWETLLSHSRPSPFVAQLIPPYDIRLSPARIEALFQSFSGIEEPIALEFSGTFESRRITCRAESRAALEAALGLLEEAYPQMDVRMLVEDGKDMRDGEAQQEHAEWCGADPLRVRSDEVVETVDLDLARPVYLPIKTPATPSSGRSGGGTLFASSSVQKGELSTGIDAVESLLMAMSVREAPLRLISQVVLNRASTEWSTRYKQLAVLEARGTGGKDSTSSEKARAFSPTTPKPIPIALVGVLFLFILYSWGKKTVETTPALLFPLLGAALLVCALAGFALWVYNRRGLPVLYDRALVAEKVNRMAFRSAVRLIAISSPDSDPASPGTVLLTARAALRRKLRQELAHVFGAYQQFSLASGNQFVARRRLLDPRCLRLTEGWKRLFWLFRSPMYLTCLELVGLWHLPFREADIAYLERTTFRNLPPMPQDVAHGCPIGWTKSLGKRFAIHLPDFCLSQNQLIIAKTGNGKTTYLEHLINYALQQRTLNGRRLAVIVIEPHRSLTERALSFIPPDRRSDAIVLDVSNAQRPFSLNLLDPLVWDDKYTAIADLCDIFNRIWTTSWGPRMEDVTRYGLYSLWEANVKLCGSGATQDLYTPLDLVPLLTVENFRLQIIDSLDDPTLVWWWRTQFQALPITFLEEIIRPVNSKFNKFVQNKYIANMLGQPSCKLDLDTMIANGQHLFVDLAAGKVGDDVAGLMGALLLGLIERAAMKQDATPEAERTQFLIFLDEFQTIAAADFSRLLGQMRKFGLTFVLATQSLENIRRLSTVGDLRAQIFSNIHTLGTFGVSAEDARYLEPEFDNVLSSTDLTNITRNTLYLKTANEQRRLPPFSCQTLPPLLGNKACAAEIRRASGILYGEDAASIEALRLQRYEYYCEQVNSDFTGTRGAASKRGGGKNERGGGPAGGPRLVPAPAPEAAAGAEAAGERGPTAVVRPGFLSPAPEPSGAAEHSEHSPLSPPKETGGKKKAGKADFRKPKGS